MLKITVALTAIPAALAAVSGACCQLGVCCGAWWCPFC